jgi:predicted O-methyltransferase YrrM
MLYLLLESLYKYGDLDPTATHILIYTTSEFRRKIQESEFMSPVIQFEINDTYVTVEQACKARLDIFELASTKNYDNILYLDTDILVCRPIQPLFELIQGDILYVGKEGDITDKDDYWGNSLFGDDELLHYQDTAAFSSGIMLFRHCAPIRNLFDDIKDQIRNTTESYVCHDQPFIVYNAFKYNLYDNMTITPYIAEMARVNDHDTNCIIHHFAGNPGSTEKLDNMRLFLFTKNEANIQAVIAKTKNVIEEQLLPIMLGGGEPIEGNIFMRHHSDHLSDVYVMKCNNLCNIALNTQIRHGMEIGFNAGFSALLVLMSNPYMKLTCFDLGEHGYTRPCFAKLKDIFGDRIDIIYGDSMRTLPLHVSTRPLPYDVIHIDGGHSKEVAESDIRNCFQLTKMGTILVMDDTDFPELRTLWDHTISLYGLKELQSFVYWTPQHDIRFV